MSGEFARAAAEYEALLAQAQADTGLSDFGPDEFRAGLRVLSADLAGDHGPAANAIRGVVQANLKKRLELLARRAAEPAVADEVIERPVFVIGLPRTGTTALVDMMAQD